MVQPEHAASDIPARSWVDRFAPAVIRPYLVLARMDRPIGTWLLLLPCWWSVALAVDPATAGWPDVRLMALFAIGALVMRGAGCTINDIVDRDIDAKVARTALRPIPSGAVSVPQAVAFLALQLLCGLAVMVQFNTYTMVLGISSLGLVVLYPFAKRFTYWPQLILGLTFNWGALLGWSAVRGQLDWPAIALYAAGVAWTLGYDTIYAHQDKEDDIQIGVKSTALKFGDNTVPWLMGFYTLAILLIGTAGYLGAIPWPFYVGLGLCAAHLAWQIVRVDVNNAADCMKKFKSNRDFGLLLFAAIVAGHVIPL